MVVFMESILMVHVLESVAILMVHVLESVGQFLSFFPLQKIHNCLIPANNW